MFKYLLWFSRYPADEREAAILSVAYQRSLASTWIGLILFLFLVSPFSGVLRSISLEYAIILLEIVLLASIFSGWTAVRREYLEFKPVSHAGRWAFWKLAAVWLAATFVGMLPILAQPRLFYVSIFSVFVAYVVSSMAWAWNWTRPYTIHSRSLAMLLLPFQTVGFLLEPKAALAKRVLLTIVLTIAAIGVPVALWVPFVNTVASAGGFSGPFVPGVGNGSGFHPIIEDYRLIGGLHVGDLVEFGTNRTNNLLYQMNNRFGRVTSINGDLVSIEVQDAFGQSTDTAEPDVIRLVDQRHVENVPRDLVFAKLILDAPLAHWLYRVDGFDPSGN